MKPIGTQSGSAANVFLVSPELPAHFDGRRFGGSAIASATYGAHGSAFNRRRCTYAGAATANPGAVVKGKAKAQEKPKAKGKAKSGSVPGPPM